MNVAIITAAGKGTRLKSNISKQFLNIYDKPILAHTLSIFEKTPKIDAIYVSVPEDYLDSCRKDIVEKYKFSKVRKPHSGRNRCVNQVNVILFKRGAKK